MRKSASSSKSNAKGTRIARELRGFELASPRVEEGARTFITSVWGLAKTGKTHFAFTAPDPIAYFHMDLGGQRIVDRVCKNKIVLVSDHRESTRLTDIPERGAGRPLS